MQPRACRTNLQGLDLQPIAIGCSLLQKKKCRVTLVASWVRQVVFERSSMKRKQASTSSPSVKLAASAPKTAGNNAATHLKSALSKGHSQGPGPASLEAPRSNSSGFQTNSTRSGSASLDKISSDAKAAAAIAKGKLGATRPAPCVRSPSSTNMHKLTVPNKAAVSSERQAAATATIPKAATEEHEADSLLSEELKRQLAGRASDLWQNQM